MVTARTNEVTKVSGITAHSVGSPQNAGLRNALLNFINRDDKGGPLKLRLGSLGRIAHSDVQSLVNALDDLKKTGHLQASDFQQTINSLVKLFKSKELEQAIQVKLKEDSLRSAENIREAGEVLATIYPVPQKRDQAKYQQKQESSLRMAA